LLNYLNDWYDTIPATLSSQFRQSIASSVEQALYTLAEHSADDLARGLKTLISRGDSAEIDIEHAVDVLLRLVGRAISADENFISEVRHTVAKLEHPATTKKTQDIESRIKELHMYYKPKDDIVRTGDIVNITVEVSEQSKSFKGVVITPACDLAHPRTAFLRMALINQKTTTGKPGDDKWEMSFLDKQDKGFEACFHEILVVENQPLIADVPPDQRPVMSYKHSYQTLNGAKAVLEREKRLDEPYRADLLHHFASHAGRIGLPEFTAPG
jgi:sulfur transfer complex TusBCD TusB component (DsrH family)